MISWLLGDSHDPLNLLEKYFLSNILLDNSASPLRKALELSKIGKSPSPFLGIEPSNKEIVFMAGLEGVEKDKADEVEELILNTLKNLVIDGVPEELNQFLASSIRNWSKRSIWWWNALWIAINAGMYECLYTP